MKDVLILNPTVNQSGKTPKVEFIILLHCCSLILRNSLFLIPGSSLVLVELIFPTSVSLLTEVCSYDNVMFSISFTFNSTTVEEVNLYKAPSLDIFMATFFQVSGGFFFFFFFFFPL